MYEDLEDGDMQMSANQYYTLPTSNYQTDSYVVWWRKNGDVEEFLRYRDQYLKRHGGDQ